MQQVLGDDPRMPTSSVILTGSDAHSTWSVSASQVFTPTLELRWSKDGALQQAWRGDVSGEVVWRDVPHDIEPEHVEVEE